MQNKAETFDLLQVVIAAWASNFQASQTFARLMSGVPQVDDAMFGRFAGSVHANGPMLFTFLSQIVPDRDRSLVEHELGSSFWTVNSTVLPPGAILVPFGEQYGPIIMNAHKHGELFGW
jgi:hypothetical protein